MASKTIDLAGSGIEGRGRNGWFKVNRMDVFTDTVPGEPRKAYVMLASSRPTRGCAPIVIEGENEGVIEALEAVLTFLRGEAAETRPSCGTTSA